jgi:type II secretory ATPase GspE/PulE/Tfp pilus assembly ATPase PilB-like protein
VISEKTNPEEPESIEADDLESEEKILLAPSVFEDMDWWPDLSDIDRINILSSPLEDRARLLASKYSRELIETMREIGKKSDLSYVDDFELPESPTKLLPLRMIHNYSCLPIGLDEDGRIELVAVWPPSKRMSRWVFAVSGRTPVWSLSSPEKISRAITENFGIGADSLDDSDLDVDGEEDAQDDLEDQNAAIIRFVNEVIQRAIVDRATDIHFEPHKETLQIRYRIDGQLVPVRVPDNLRSFQDAIISRIKIMSAINISEKRRPQGGRITFNQGQSDLDIRVSTLPTLYGESISLRLLNEKSQPLSMRELGLVAEDEKNIVSILDKPHGIVLVTGPTGSGKSTSLTAFIRRIHKPERRIMTVEDPVEYEVAGINQTQVNSEIGFTFSSALREILRQDPDVIMVGEIRDRETADIAIRASLTGHLVLSTLHTNDAPGAITRLVDMEIEPFLIASSVEMVIAQRLVRRLCQECSSPAQMSESDLLASLSLLEVDPSEMLHGDKVLRSTGCQKCQNLGYRGRVGIFELMKMSDAIHGLVINNASAPDIREIALEEGMSTLQGSGWEQIKRGFTTFDEVIRYADGFIDEQPATPFEGDETQSATEDPIGG